MMILPYSVGRALFVTKEFNAYRQDWMNLMFTILKMKRKCFVFLVNFSCSENLAIEQK
jgi:hypothetical protein